MTHLNNKQQYNELDYYLLVFRDSGEIYEKFRNKSAAEKFLKNHPLQEVLDLIVNPKYDVTRK